jgi:anti-sigma B factor antagonist
MTGEGFAVGVVRRDDGVVLELSGTVNRAAKGRMEEAYQEGGQGDRILLDFTRVEYINSTGIAVIVGLLAMARAEGREVGAFGLNEHYRKVFQITRLADFMTMYDSEAAAVAAD